MPNAQCCSSEAMPRPPAMLPLRDLSAAALLGTLPGGQFPDGWTESLSRGLFRSARSVVLIGEPGVGKSALVEELVRQADAGKHRHLIGKRFVSVDGGRVPCSDAAPFLAALGQSSRQRPETIWCLENVGSLLGEPDALRTFLKETTGGVILSLTREQATDLAARDALWWRDGTRIDLEEPDEPTTLSIVRHHAERLAEEFELTIPPDVVERTVVLTSHYLLSERHPGKGIRLLRNVCEDLTFDRQERGVEIQAIQLPHVLAALSERTGIPAETLSGISHQVDFEAALSAAVVGQQPAITEVAKELRIIKSGLNEPGKPASVMLFAGMTGVGKTELAKRIAEVYSSSRRLQTYTMANFTEPHSVSGIIGVPPGYVGYEQGGRLINELNADPYSVFLLDEAEKAHPNVWKPFLNLFDEGWIVDQRGVKASADRAIFILTTNAGDRNIAQMTRNGQPSEQIAEHVKQALSKVRHERSSQPVFPPAFLARIGRIVVFQPLDEQAMIGIAERTCRRMQQLWHQKRGQHIPISPDVVTRLGQRGHQLNEQSGGREGGRMIKKLVADFIEERIQIGETT